MILRRLLVQFYVFYVALFAVTAAGASELLLTSEGTFQGGSEVTWLKGSELTPAEAFDLLLAGKGQAIEPSLPYLNLGYTTDKPWLLLEVNNATDELLWYVEAGSPVIERLDLYVFNANKELLSFEWSGAKRKVVDRPFYHHRLVFPVTLSTGTSYLLFRAQSFDRMTVPITLRDETSFFYADTASYLWYGVLFGTIGILCLYNLLIFFSTREKSYLSYVLYLGFFGFFLFSQAGFSLRWVWPNALDWNMIAVTMFALVTVAFSVLFARHFMQTDLYSPRIDKALKALEWFMYLATIATFFFFESMSVFSSLIIIPWPLIALVVALYIWYLGNAIAGYFFLSFLVVGVSAVLYGLMNVGLIPNSWLLDNSLQLAVLIEALLLSFALAHRMNIIKRENEHLQFETQQRLEARVNERTNKLQQAMEARSQFLAVMSHEIRTPLNGIMGTLDLFCQSKLSDTQKKQAHIIESSGNALLRLIDDILDYSRIDAGKLIIDKGSFNLKKLVDECLQMFVQKAGLRGNKLSLDFSPLLPTFVTGDAMRIRQVIINLVSNAVKFTENGEIKLIVKPKDDSDHIFFLVKDNGIGIPKEKRANLFDLFAQADSSTSRKYGGAGLGLAICRRLVLLMGGSIGVESEAKRGSVFWFHLPLPIAEQVEEQVVESEEVGSLSGRVLIVDDNYVNLMVAEGICRQLGLAVRTCESGAEAIAVLLHDSDKFDAVLMDCEMPEMDGFETTREIIRLQQLGRIPSIPVAALTAHAVPDKIRACHESGMVMHIAKPVRMESLRDSLRVLLAQ